MLLAGMTGLHHWAQLEIQGASNSSAMEHFLPVKPAVQEGASKQAQYPLW